jgi:hypothetical protein
MNKHFCKQCNFETINAVKICPNCGNKGFDSFPLQNIATENSKKNNLDQNETRKQKGWKFAKAVFGWCMLGMIFKIAFTPLNFEKIFEVLVGWIFGGLIFAAIAYAIGLMIPKK